MVVAVAVFLVTGQRLETAVQVSFWFGTQMQVVNAQLAALLPTLAATTSTRSQVPAHLR
jgi:hypothetical protein